VYIRLILPPILIARDIAHQSDSDADPSPASEGLRFILHLIRLIWEKVATSIRQTPALHFDGGVLADR
jgi:hypothetical protein